MMKSNLENIEKFWANAITFDDYLSIAKKRAETSDSNDPYQQYYDLGVQRMERTLKKFEVKDEDLEVLESKNSEGKVLIISEPWCGDASATVPAVTKFFEAAGTEVRIFLRDYDQELINQFLTNGTQSIPIILLLNNDFTVKSVWGPRPKYGTTLLKKFKEDPEAYPRETFYNDLQIYYAKNRGADAIEEILNSI